MDFCDCGEIGGVGYIVNFASLNDDVGRFCSARSQLWLDKTLSSHFSLR